MFSPGHRLSHRAGLLISPTSYRRSTWRSTRSSNEMDRRCPLTAPALREPSGPLPTRPMPANRGCGPKPFLERLRTGPVWVKLDTNGSRPAVLREILVGQLVDYVAMDVKAPPDRYIELAGSQADVADIDASMRLLRGSSVDYEFRATVIDSWHREADIIEIARWIAPARRYILQRFNPHTTR